jgi:hypothetical protein
MARVTAVAGEGGGFTIRASCIEVLAARPGLQLPLITHLGYSEYSHGGTLSTHMGYSEYSHGVL